MSKQALYLCCPGHFFLGLRRYYHFSGACFRLASPLRRIRPGFPSGRACILCQLALIRHHTSHHCMLLRCRISLSFSPSNLGTALNRMLAFRQYTERVAGKLAAGDNLLHMLLGTCWGRGGTIFLCSMSHCWPWYLLLLYTTPLCGAPNYRQTRKRDAHLSNALPVVTGCFPSSSGLLTGSCWGFSASRTAKNLD